MHTEKPMRGGGCRWGYIDSVTELAPGIWTVSTPSHGGMVLARELFQQIPEEFRPTKYSGGGSFEEDCDWAVPYVWFADLIRKTAQAFEFDANLKVACMIVKQYHKALHTYLIGKGRMPESA